MIAYVSGVVAEKAESYVVIDVAGLGYKLLTTGQLAAQLVDSSATKLYVYEHIREDAHDLYGFLENSDKRLFEQLLSVKNVGPKVALSVLDIGRSNDVRAAIAGGDVKRLQTAKGVGKRAAEQIVVELRDKVGVVASDEAEGIVNRGAVDLSDEAVMALMSLGYSDFDAVRALKNIDESLTTEERIKQALRRGSND